ncbi:hypothetical protein B0H17DRAFT_1110663 [Mycena rosella]|uniref:DUF6533 domain-containing protein n=1 Tax=Mycena rosella TaxID=1033263 RepID=A0AAD7BNY1_MYCRO|nr:hypothetical protein B0H17DRAFT_1110663 [Mycena rosella]
MIDVIQDGYIIRRIAALSHRSPSSLGQAATHPSCTLYRRSRQNRNGNPRTTERQLLFEPRRIQCVPLVFSLIALMISAALLFYEYFLTLDWEVSRYWTIEFKAANLLFYANRYSALLGNILVVFQYFWTTPSSPAKSLVCSSVETYHQYFILVNQFLVGAMLILRTYALYGRNNRILAFLLVVAAGTIAVAVWAVISGKPEDDGMDLPLYFGCTYAISHEKGVSLAGAWAGLATFDSVIFVLTLYRALSRHNSNGLTLLGVLIRDGSIYFGVIVAASLSNILTFLFGEPYTRGLVTTFANIIAAIMISRLMLNLRDPALSGIPDGTHSTAWTGTGITGMFSSRVDFSGPGGLLETRGRVVSSGGSGTDVQGAEQTPGAQV